MNWGELVFRTARALPRVSVCWSNFPSGRRSANESMMPLDGAAAHRVEISSGPRKIWPEKTLRAEPQPNVDDVAVWTELECVIFPSSQRRARSASPIGRSLKSGCAIKKMPRIHKSGADGREARAQ